MAKSIAITPRIAEWIKAAAGEELDPNTVTVFEASVFNTKPLKKKGSIYEGATATRLSLTAMADYLNNGESVPLHTLHLQGDELPVGKMIHAEVLDAADGSAEVRALFYLPNKTQAKLIADIEAAVLDEVSVGVDFKHLNCSECGWDFKGEDASFLNLFDRVCANDHQIGKDGVHLVLSGLNKWMETSLVSKGAAVNPKILARAKQALSADDRQRLAASGRSIETDLVIATFENKDRPMDTAAFTAEISKQATLVASANAERDTAKTALAASDAKVKELETKLAAADATITELKKDDKAAALAAANEKITGLEASATEVTAYLSDQAKLALTATGKTDAPATDAKGLIAQIKDAGVTLLASGVQPGGKAAPAGTGTSDTEAPKKNFGAFKSRN